MSEKQMPVSGTQIYGTPKGKPSSTSKLTMNGGDLRSK